MARADTIAGHEVVEFRIEKWVYGGRGLGRLDGGAVLVPWVLPGERVRARIEKRRPGLSEAALEEVLKASPARRPPACPYFGRCGGCHYQHASYDAQIAGKRDVLAETLRRVGRVEPPAEIEIVAGAPWGYRNRLQFHLSGGKIGFHRPASHDLCAVERCPIAAPGLNDALAALRDMMRDPRFPRFLGSIELFTNGTEVLVNARDSARPLARRFFEWCAERIPGAGAGSLDYAGGGRLFRVSHGSFFQVNRFLIEELVKKTVRERGESALALYAGAGLFRWSWPPATVRSPASRRAPRRRATWKPTPPGRRPPSPSCARRPKITWRGWPPRRTSSSPTRPARAWDAPLSDTFFV
jgi:23S rRNA (uracil1939-C5)-methyltransferase